jgi:S1-C subfamily serine protease
LFLFMEDCMALNLGDFSDSLAALIDASAGQVVRVDARHRIPASGTVWSQDGVIVTAHHVIEHDENILISVGDKKDIPARLIGRDPTTDLAALQVDGLNISPIERASSESARVGSLIVALGRPGTNIRASMGMINAVGENWRTGAGGTIDRYIQTSVEMLPGFSGGPLIDFYGHLLGVNTSALQQDGFLTLPVETIDRVVKSLLAHGKIRRAYLGITSQPVRLGEQAASQAGQATGLMIIGIEAGGPAASAGILQGDILLAAGGMSTRRIEDLMAALTIDDLTHPVQLKILRGGNIQEIAVQPIERTQ